MLCWVQIRPHQACPALVTAHAAKIFVHRLINIFLNTADLVCSGAPPSAADQAAATADVGFIGFA